MTDPHEIDPVIVDYVTSTANRFGVQGLEDLISLAQKHLLEARESLKQLEDLDG